MSEYASEKLWQPWEQNTRLCGARIENNGNEKAFCCFNSNARDFARIGQLMLDSGKWKGNAIIDSAYYMQSVTAVIFPMKMGWIAMIMDTSGGFARNSRVFFMPGAF